MRITVTAEHIEGAKCGKPQHCMIAEAIRDCVRRVKFVSVRTNGITITQSRNNGNSLRTHWTVPLKAARAIIKFDAGEHVSPFSFEPELVSEKELAPVPDEYREKRRQQKRTDRAALRARGEPTHPKGRKRIAGV